MTEVIVMQLAGLIGGDIHSYLFLSSSVVLFGAALAGLLWLDRDRNPWRWRRHTPQHRGERRPWAPAFNAGVAGEVLLRRLAGLGR